jgi:hypothetical protein
MVDHRFSARALSKLSPVLPVEGATPASTSRWVNRSAVYWALLSLWKINSPTRTSRECSAWLSAVSTSVVVARGSVAQPTMRLANASRTLASHSTPSPMTSRVRSAAQSPFGASARKSRSTRSGAAVWCGFCRVEPCVGEHWHTRPGQLALDAAAASECHEQCLYRSLDTGALSRGPVESSCGSVSPRMRLAGPIVGAVFAKFRTTASRRGGTGEAGRAGGGGPAGGSSRR